ncbi:uncharacterized protein ARMOST_02143 [Armillaria ostoyae]|uniref:Major facilitator superfamily (MFS) profile domain-containing protein n=1 Tax=Armillaria ostoyae TaxID=47428 RepID=A0A284QQY3_ARMOS|nr:uncharacterized protein ARMOST_02143 [Armillaria ostoyae]
MPVPPEIPSNIIEKIPASGTLTKSSGNTASRPTEESIHELDSALYDCPDGGLQAWLTVAGVILTLFELDISKFTVLTFGVVPVYTHFTSGANLATILKGFSVVLPNEHTEGPPTVRHSLDWFHSVLTQGILAQSPRRSTLRLGILPPPLRRMQPPTSGRNVGFAVGVGAIHLHLFVDVLIQTNCLAGKRLKFALGLMAVGSSLGGTVIPIATRNLLPLVGFKWTMRIIALILLLGLGLSNLLIKRRFPPTDIRGGLFNFHEFKSASFSLYCASTLTSFLGIYTVLTYIDVSATKVGVPEDFSFYLVSIANCSSGFGRYFAGLLGDRIGAMNVMIPFTAASAIVTYSWPYARDQNSLITIAVIYGFTSGSFVSLLCAPIIEFGDTTGVGRRVGMMMSILAVGALVGPPISGSINSATGGFEAVGYYAGRSLFFRGILWAAKTKPFWSQEAQLL